MMNEAENCLYFGGQSLHPRQEPGTERGGGREGGNLGEVQSVYVEHRLGLEHCCLPKLGHAPVEPL